MAAGSQNGVLTRGAAALSADESPDWGPNFALRGLKSLRVDTQQVESCG